MHNYFFRHGVELQNGKKISSTGKVESFPVRSKFYEVDSGFKGHLQNKPMQEISKFIDHGLCKVRTKLGSGITN